MTSIAVSADILDSHPEILGSGTKSIPSMGAGS